MNRYAKPYKSYREQVALLASRGLAIDDFTAAERVLSMVGYYRLSGYWYPYRVRGVHGRSSDFAAGTSLSQVLALYEMDRRLKLLTMDAVERVEIAMRVRVGHTLGP